MRLVCEVSLNLSQEGQNVRMTAAGDALSGRQSDGNGYIGGSLLIYVV